MAEPPTKIVIDFANTHLFKGFGVHTWMSSPHMAERDVLLKALNVRFIRASLPGLFPDTALPLHASVADVSALIEQHVDQKAEAKIVRFRDEVSPLGIRLHIIFWAMPEQWRADPSGQSHLASPAHLADYVNYMTAQLLYVQKLNLKIEAVELTNEPNGVWSTQYTPQQYDQLVVLMRVALDSVGLNEISIEGPGTSNRPTDFMNELKKTGHIGLLGAYSFHEYDTRDGIEPSGLRLISPSLDGAPTRPVFITEFNDVSPRFDASKQSAVTTVDKDGENPSLALGRVAEATKLVADGASEIVYWHLEDLPWQQRTTGLLNRVGKEKMTALALKAVFQNIIPPTAVASVYGCPPDISFLGIKSDDGMLIFGVNIAKSPSSIDLKIVGVTAGPTVPDDQINGQIDFATGSKLEAFNLEADGAHCTVKLNGEGMIILRIRTKD